MLNTKANLKTLGMVLLLRAQEIQQLYDRLCILVFSLDTCACLRMVDDRKFLAF